MKPKFDQREICLGILGTILWFPIYRLLQPFSEWFVYDFGRFEKGVPFSSALEFFVYEVPKVLMLLAVVVFGMGIMRSFFTPARTRKMLSGKSESVGNVLAALLGTVTPFCSCSAVPLFIGFVAAGVPLGVTFSFLISAPMVNEVAVVLLWGLFGWKVALIYFLMGLCIAILAGWIMGKMKLERYIESWVFQTHVESEAESKLSWRDRLQHGCGAVRDIVGKVWLYVVAGIAVGAGIHGYVPEDFMAALMGRGAWWAVPVAVLLGVPMYSNAAGIIPVVQALLGKGAALGTSLALMMSVIGLSLPEAIILRKVLKLPLIMIFFGVVAVGIIVVGYLFNYFI